MAMTREQAAAHARGVRRFRADVALAEDMRSRGWLVLPPDPDDEDGRAALAYAQGTGWHVVAVAYVPGCQEVGRADTHACPWCNFHPDALDLGVRRAWDGQAMFP